MYRPGRISTNELLARTTYHIAEQHHEASRSITQAQIR